MSFGPFGWPGVDTLGRDVDVQVFTASGVVNVIALGGDL